MATITYTMAKDIRIKPETCFCVPCYIDNTGLTADSDGKKIIYAGTPIGHLTVDIRKNGARTSVLISTNDATNYASSQGVLLEDVDVTASGTHQGVVLLSGAIDTLKCGDVTFNANAVAALVPNILFVKGRA